MKPENRHIQPRGFIALISAVLISVVLLGLATAAGTSAFFSRFDALNAEFKRASLGLAEACIHSALFKISDNYNYVVTADPAYNLSRGGVVVPMGIGDCVIKSPTATPIEINGKRTFNLITQGQYRGAFSNVFVSALAQSPTSTPLIPPPNCAFNPTAISVPQGQSFTFSWSTSGSSITSFDMDHGVGSLTPFLTGSKTVTVNNSPGVVTYNAIVANAGGSNPCSITITVTPPPPAPACADTVMILDRTGSMSNTNLNDEETAANALVSLYQGVSPGDPKVGVGSFGAYPNQSLPAGAASIHANGLLTSVYGNITSALNQITGSNSSVGSNLAAAITVGAVELNSARHVIDGTTGEYPKKVLVFVSDGLPNEPSGSTAGATGFKVPSAESQNASGDFWNNPTNAFVDNSGDASEAISISESDRHRFFNFNFPTIPSNATIVGIEAKTDAWATTVTTVQTPASSQKAPTSTVSPNQWTNPTRAFTSDNSYTTNSTNAQQQGYGNFGFSIPSNATVTGLQVTTEASITGFGASTVTGTLTPNGQGTYDDWTGDESDIDETGAVQCGSSDGNENVATGNTNDRQSVNLDLTSIPDGSNITSISITTSYTDDTSSGSDGTFRTFARVNGSNTDAGTNLVASGSSSSSCNHTDAQVINVPDTIKSGSTDIEIGVVKTSTDTSSVWVGSLRAVITYQPPVTGSLSVALSANNGGAWTSGKTINLDSTESVDATPADLWGRPSWTPAEVNSGLALRVTNTSSVGTVNLDQVLVTVNYTAPTPAPSACTLAMDLSWNGSAGTPSWTTEKTQTVTAAETTYSFGSASDDWNGHTWAPGDFTNGNFRARVHASDPGANCDNASVDHLDLLQIQVSYTIPTDPTQAALDAASLAKSAGGPDNTPISIFSIHFGDSSGQDLMSQLASASTLSVANITTATRTGGTATITTATPHKFVENQRVVISGVSNSQFNGTYTITTVPTPNSFRYALSGTSSGSGGTASPTNLFIAPSSTDMQGIFQSIGTQVCPAAGAQCANTIDDDGDSLTDEFDPACHTDGNAGNAASYDPLDNDEWETPGVPVPPPPPPPPPSIQLGSWTQV